MGRPSAGVVKTLFALSGNTCAYAGCEQTLTDPTWPEVNADIAHICGDRPASARYVASMSDKERQSYHNLMLLCPTCHRVIDRVRPKDHPAELLRDMKQRHEGAVASPESWGSESRFAMHAVQAIVQLVSLPLDELRPFLREVGEELVEDGMDVMLVQNLTAEVRRSTIAVADQNADWEERARRREDRLRAERERRAREFEAQRAQAAVNVTPARILEVCAGHSGFSAEDIVGKSRNAKLVTARQISMYVMRELTELSYPAIAREYGGRDHTTIIHAVEKIKALMKERRQIHDQVTEVLRILRGE